MDEALSETANGEVQISRAYKFSKRGASSLKMRNKDSQIRVETLEKAQLTFVHLAHNLKRRVSQIKTKQLVSHLQIFTKTIFDSVFF